MPDKVHGGGAGTLPPSRRADVIPRRQADWRYGRIVYQVLVDRFAPSARLDGKRQHYASPRMIREWNELPRRGVYIENVGNMEGELEFWGGDLESLNSRLEHVSSLGAEVLYLNPIFHAFTNHKYDALSYFEIDPQFGALEDLRSLVQNLHSRGMHLILDGVFNHMGRRSPLFLKAMEDPQSPEREFFTFTNGNQKSYLGWRNARNLPELRLENETVRQMIYAGTESVVQKYLRDGLTDGWRLDVAPDIGFDYLRELTEAAHAARPDSVVIGECWNYPEEWLGVLDGILNMHTRELVLGVLKGRITPTAASTAIERMVNDTGIDGVLRCHLVLDNHDTARLATMLPDLKQRCLARVLQFTLPGCPVIYYGSELGMEGGNDPDCRAPMRWDLANKENRDYADIRELISIRRENPALSVGDYRRLDAHDLLAYLRLTRSPLETIVVLINPLDEDIHEMVPVRDSRLADAAPMKCLLSGETTYLRSGFIDVEVPARSARLFRTTDRGGENSAYSMFKRLT